jgi:hypothetical protein
MKGIKYRVVSDYFCDRAQTDEIGYRKATHDVDNDDYDDDTLINTILVTIITEKTILIIAHIHILRKILT